MTQSSLTTRLYKWSLVCGAVIFIGVWLYSNLAQGIYGAIHFDGFIADGPFQLYNPLRRIAAGQTAGVEFQFFHGLGVPFLHYPIFALFGKNLLASELSRNLVSPLCFISSILIMGYVVTRKSITNTLLFTASVICLLELLVYAGLDSYGHPLATPGNSLLGVRSTVPLLAFAVLLSEFRPLYKAVLTGGLLAAALFFGTEHGLALIVSYLGIGGIVCVKQIRAEASSIVEVNSINWKFLALSTLSFIVFLIVLFGIFSTIEAIGPVLKYNLSEVAGDQFWYFGAPPNDYAKSFVDFLELPWKALLIYVVTLISLFLLLGNSLYLRKQPMTWEQLAITQMLAYGMISCASCLGMLEPGYTVPMTRVFVIAILVFIIRNELVKKGRDLIVEARPRWTRSLVTVSYLITIFAFITLVYIFSKRVPPVIYNLTSNPSLQYSILWEKHLQIINSNINNQFGDSSKPTVWSTYAGLLEGQRNIFHPREDYIIHALGPNRRQEYLDAFRANKPDLVQSLRRSHFIHYTQGRDYEQWLRNTSWEFYEDILNNYEIKTSTDRSILWQRKSSEWVQPDLRYHNVLYSGSESVEIPLDKVIKPNSLIVVRLKYKINNPWERLPFLGKTPRYLVKISNANSALPISLPPYKREVLFPINIKTQCKPGLVFETQSLLPYAAFQVEAVEYKIIELGENQTLFLKD